MDNSRKVLIVDDEPGMLEVAQMYFQREGFQVALALDGGEALEAVRHDPPDLVILDLMLPVMDGWEVCRRIRQQGGIPIIMLTARDEETDKIVGLELGADDYVTKPFNPRELVARAKAVLRRGASPEAAVEPPSSLKIGSLSLDRAARRALVQGSELALTPKEFDLLWLLAAHPGVCFDRQRLLDAVWGYGFPGGTRTVDMHVAQLRKKIREAGLAQPNIHTLPRLGYRLDLE